LLLLSAFLIIVAMFALVSGWTFLGLLCVAASVAAVVAFETGPPSSASSGGLRRDQIRGVATMIVLLTILLLVCIALAKLTS
jgi:hypothetical protein